MKFLGQISCHALLLVAAMGSGSRGEMPTARIEIDSTSREAEIPAALYGIFMEEINHAFDGGIYAELIQNRSFEEGVLPPGVKLVQRRGGGEKMELTSLPVGVPKKDWDMPWPWRDNCHWNPRRVLVAWSLETDGNDRMEVTADHPMNEASTRSLALDIDQPDGAPTGRRW